KLDPVLAAEYPLDHELFPIGGPVGIPDVFQDAARGSPRERNARQGAGSLVWTEGRLRPQHHRELARWRDGEQTGVLDSERPRLRAFRAREKQLDRIASPGGAVDHRVAVRGKTRVPDHAAPKRQPLERRRSGLRTHVSREESERG